MKKLLLIVLFIYSINTVHARKIHSQKSGCFASSSTWVDGKTPADGDTVTIDSGHIVLVEKHLCYSGHLMIINIYGTLNFNKAQSRLQMPYGSYISIMAGGQLTTSGKGNVSRRTIANDSFTLWEAFDGNITGPERID